MLLLAFPPYGPWPLAWFALVPALLAQFRLLSTRWSSLGDVLGWAALAGFVFFMIFPSVIARRL